ERVRVAVRKGRAPAVGSFVEFKAHLSPPLQPLRPGGCDFAREMYFQRIGPSGYALGAIKVRRRWLCAAALIDRDVWRTHHYRALEQQAFRAKRHTAAWLCAAWTRAIGNATWVDQPPPEGPVRGRQRRDQTRSRPTTSTGGIIPPACPGYAHGWAAGYVPRRRCSQVRAQSKRRGGETA